MEFAKSEFVRKYYGRVWDNLSRWEINLKCWADLVEVRHKNKRMPDAVALATLGQLRRKIEVAKEKKLVMAPGSGRKSARAKTLALEEALAKTVEFEARRAALLVILAAIVRRLEADPLQEPECLQQVCHKNRTCDGELCRAGDEPIYGWRWCCQSCHTDYCQDCYEAHTGKHVLSLHREVLQEDAAVPSDKWSVNRIDSHQDTVAGREYLVVWGGKWKDSYHLKAELGNEELVDQYVYAHCEVVYVVVSAPMLYVFHI